jgi:hypothetical protein
VNLLLVTLVVLAFVVSVGPSSDGESGTNASARLDSGRKRLLGRRKPTASYREILERRSRRG